MRGLLPWAYGLAVFGFIYLPVATLVLFSFQDGSLPVPPFNGPSLRWYGDILGDDDLMEALLNSLAVAIGSSAVAVALGFCAAYGWRAMSCRLRARRPLLIAALNRSYLIVVWDCSCRDHLLGLGLRSDRPASAMSSSTLADAAIIYASMARQQQNGGKGPRAILARKSAGRFLTRANAGARDPRLLPSVTLNWTSHHRLPLTPVRRHPAEEIWSMPTAQACRPAVTAHRKPRSVSVSASFFSELIVSGTR